MATSKSTTPSTQVPRKSSTVTGAKSVPATKAITRSPAAKPRTSAPVSKAAIVAKALKVTPVAPTVKASESRPAAKAAGKAVTPAKVEKSKKPKLVRDSFTIPKPEYLVMETLKERAGKLSRAIKKSELLRAGIKALAAMNDAQFLAALQAVPTIKTGRPVATA